LVENIKGGVSDQKSLTTANKAIHSLFKLEQVYSKDKKPALLKKQAFKFQV